MRKLIKVDLLQIGVLVTLFAQGLLEGLLDRQENM